MARYQVTLAYDGTLFKGFQRQGSSRTVQLVVEDALRRLNWQGRAILSSGRTDSGVHAQGQVVAFDLDWAHSPEALGNALSAALPDDVGIKKVQQTSDTFHPRYDARARCYHYHLMFAPLRDPLSQRYTWRVWPACEFDLLQAAAALLPGIHDFAAFGTPPRPGGSTTRQVFRAGWQCCEDGRLRFEVVANAFLYHMVRRMVFLQVMVGQQRLSLEQWRTTIEAAQPAIPGLAPPQGLALVQVDYPPAGTQVNVTLYSE